MGRPCCLRFLLDKSEDFEREPFDLWEKKKKSETEIFSLDWMDAAQILDLLCVCAWYHKLYLYLYTQWGTLGSPEAFDCLGGEELRTYHSRHFIQPAAGIYRQCFPLRMCILSLSVLLRASLLFCSPCKPCMHGSFCFKHISHGGDTTVWERGWPWVSFINPLCYLWMTLLAFVLGILARPEAQTGHNLCV